MLRRYLLFFGACLIGLVIFLWAENEFSKSFQDCITEYSSGQASKDSNKQRFNVAIFVKAQSICTVRLVDKHNGFFAAIAAFIVAWFTFSLRQSTDELWKAGERNFREAQRAFVFIDGFTPEITTAADIGTKPEDLPERYRSRPHLYMHCFAVVPRWKNSGNTPTRNMKMQVDWRGPPGPIPPDYVYRKAAEPFFVAPKAVESSTILDMPGASVLIDWTWRPVGVEPSVFIWGRADYEDVFKRKHFIEWCYQLRFESHDGKNLRAHFIPWGDYNRSDEDDRR
jgi:hypothetical protein